MSDANSPFSRRAYAYIERGYSVIPIAPGTKRPGEYSKESGWRGMNDWQRFSKRLPTETELEIWYTWPDAGIGLLTGPVSKLTALDRDYNTNGTDALDAIIPWTPIKKKGEKGWTGFYQWNKEPSCSFNINGVRVLDVLAEGRQTLMPGTIHPSGHTYIYLTEDILEDFDPDQLPKLPDDFLSAVGKVLAPYQTEQDRAYLRAPVAHKDNDGRISQDLSIQSQYFRDLNALALNSLDDWVPKLIPTAKAERGGYRCIAVWRNVKNPNVGIHPSGIFDFGGNYGITPIDLVMYTSGLPFIKAAEILRACLKLHEPEPIVMTVGGAGLAQRAAPAPVEVGLMPWQKPAEVVPLIIPSDTSHEPTPAIESFIASPPGIIKVMADWMTATAPKSQPELSVSAALASVSTIMGRTYRSQFGNWTSLYIIMVAKSTEGKEHPQACAEKILTHANLTQLIGGSGYTSAGAVFSALLKSACHLVTIDEMGKLLQLSRAKGQSHTEAAIDKLIEAYGRTDGIMRPPTYSTMTLKDVHKPVERVIHNPGITLLGATTPGTFYAGLTDDLVRDGFLGRCIVVESRQPRQLTRLVDRNPPPDRVLDWAGLVFRPTAGQGGNLSDVNTSEMPPTVVPLPFTDACIPMQRRFEDELNAAKERAEADGLDVLLGRTLEKSMRVAMCACKADDPNHKAVLPEHFQWAIEYVRHYDYGLLRQVRAQRHVNQVDGDLKRMVDQIKNVKKLMANPKIASQFGRAIEAGGMPHSVLLRAMHMKAADFAKLVETATEIGLVRTGPTPDLSGSTTLYFLGDAASE